MHQLFNTYHVHRVIRTKFRSGNLKGLQMIILKCGLDSTGQAGVYKS